MSDTKSPVLRFDGPTHIVDMGIKPAHKIQRELTIEAWIFATRQHKWAGILSRIFDTGATESGYGLLLDGSSGVYFGVRASKSQNFYFSSGPNTLPLNEWHHIAGTYDGKQIVIYIDGQAKATVPLSGDIDYAPDHNLTIGDFRDDDKSYPFPGKIAEVRLWSTVRSAAQIQADMKRRLSGDEPSLVGYWPLCEGRGDVVKDLTSNALHGKITGAIWENVATPFDSKSVQNPYQGAGTLWLKGEIHVHVEKSSQGYEYANGVAANMIYADAKLPEHGFDFVCMSVEVTDAKGGTAQFGDVGTGSVDGVIGIPAREIQNNYYQAGPPKKKYFTEEGADYLHVLTLGKDGGLSLCCHPSYYRNATGGAWADIRKGLLSPTPNGRLANLNVRGLEVYNGFSRLRLGKAYASFDEICWDEMLCAGHLYWGFASNDSYALESYEFSVFKKALGCVYVNAKGKNADDILAALEAGRFYSSSGLQLADNPISVDETGPTVKINVFARSSVNWTARIYEQGPGGEWLLTTMNVANQQQAQFELKNPWKYIRIRATQPGDLWKNAWLQPLTNTQLF